MTSGHFHANRTHPGVTVYHRRQLPTQSAATAARQQASGELWGTYDRVIGGRSPFPSVDAYVGPLPDGTKGIEFTTDIPPDKNTPPRVARWTGPRDGVIVEGDYGEDQGDGYQEHPGWCPMSPPAFTQIDATPWPSGYAEAIAVVHLQPEQFTRAFGLRFIEGSDNLDSYEAAPLRLRSGRMLGLLRHAGDPAPGTKVYADAGDDFVSALREFLDAFDLSVDDLSWMRDEITAEHLRLSEARAHV